MMEFVNDPLSERTFCFESRGCRKALQKYPGLQNKIITGIQNQITNGFFKTKLACRIKWKGLPVYEIRVNDPVAKAVRIAFALHQQDIHILYISTTLLKKDFTREIENFLKGESS